MEVRMAGYRSYIFPDAVVSETSVVLDGRESHHLVKVFRAREGAPVELLDGKGKRYGGTLSRADARAAVIAVDTVEELPRPKCRVTFLQSIPKGRTMDLILRMATEIGVSSIQPVFSDQGEVQIKGERLASKMEKWELTMVEACKQCGLVFLPELFEPVALSDWVERLDDYSESLRIVASLEKESRPLWETLQANSTVHEVVVAVGPEGDFSVEEYARLRNAGFRAVRLGANVLRAETAAAYLLSVVDQVLVARDMA